MCSREVDRDTGGLDHINTTNKYNHDQQLSTIIYQDAGSGVPSGCGQLNLTSQAHCNYDHKLYEKHSVGCDLSKTERVQWNKTYSTIALAKSAMERIPLHSWEMEFSIQYHVTINSQLNDQNSIKYYIIFCERFSQN
jgi:hypothetical protein